MSNSPPLPAVLKSNSLLPGKGRVSNARGGCWCYKLIGALPGCVPGRAASRAQTASLENAEIANMHSPWTHTLQASFVYFISVFDALFNVIQIPTQTLIRSKTRLQTPTTWVACGSTVTSTWQHKRAENNATPPPFMEDLSVLTNQRIFQLNLFQPLLRLPFSPWHKRNFKCSASRRFR